MIKNRKFIYLFLLVITLFIGSSITIYANPNSYFINPDIYDREISTWDSLTVYQEGNLILYDYKVYSASKMLAGSVPDADEAWICQADLTCMKSAKADNNIDVTNSSSNLKSTISTKVLSFNGYLSKSKYTYTIRCVISGGWTAGICSLISYDGGQHSIIKLDSFGDFNLLPSVSQTKSYFYNNMKSVKVMITGTYNGQELTPETAILNAP